MPNSAKSRSSKSTPTLSVAERRDLRRLASPTTPDETVQFRAKIILLWAQGLSGAESSEALGISRRTVSKWRARFREGGVRALWDRPRPGAPRTISQRQISELLRLRQTPPPMGKPRWTTRMLAERTGLSQSTVVRISRAHSGSSDL